MDNFKQTKLRDDLFVQMGVDERTVSITAYGKSGYCTVRMDNNDMLLLTKFLNTTKFIPDGRKIKLVEDGS